MTTLRQSPNFGPRRDGATPKFVVIHYTAMADCEGAIRALCDPVREVSAHYLIGRDGHCHALVDEAMRAWHAGAGAWRGITDMNSHSIGIELDNCGFSPFSAPLMDQLCVLLREIMARWDIPPEGVIGHSDLAPGRKIDPGPRFDWARLAREGLAIMPKPRIALAIDPPRFMTDCAQIGYHVDDLSLMRDTLRRRYRPHALGKAAPLDGWDCAIAADLAARFGVDRAGHVT
ncbi:N-acetylmuramoyl-L-alanine amidase [Rhodobacteraceae bacterium XHP0102]|nr:N-acetylmuramoyl-L-alanine amidase [Rhodobacteraceae bacterium XHP0102]